MFFARNAHEKIFVDNGYRSLQVEKIVKCMASHFDFGEHTASRALAAKSRNAVAATIVSFDLRFRLPISAAHLLALLQRSLVRRSSRRLHRIKTDMSFRQLVACIGVEST